MEMSQPIRVSPQSRRAEVGPVIRQPTRRWWRSAKIMAVNRSIPSQPAIDASNKLSFIGPVVFPMDRQRARLLGDRSFEIRHGREPVSAGNTINFAIPRAASKTVIKPFDGWTRQPLLVGAQAIRYFSLQRAVITLAVKKGGAVSRIKATVETPQDFPDGVPTIEKIKEVAENFATAAVDRNGIVEHAARRFLGLRTVMENAGIAIPVSREKVAARSLGKFRGWNDGSVVLIDDIKRKVLAPRNLLRQQHIRLARTSIDIDARVHAMAAQIGQY